MKTFVVESSQGTLEANAETGRVVSNNSHYDGKYRSMQKHARITCFDVGEFCKTYPGRELAGTVDILDLGYWYVMDGANGYSEPEHEWRREFGPLAPGGQAAGFVLPGAVAAVIFGEGAK